MSSRDANVRNNSLVMLQHYLGQAQEVVPVLVAALRDPDIPHSLDELSVRIDSRGCPNRHQGGSPSNSH